MEIQYSLNSKYSFPLSAHGPYQSRSPSCPCESGCCHTSCTWNHKVFVSLIWIFIFPPDLSLLKHVSGVPSFWRLHDIPFYPPPAWVCFECMPLGLRVGSSVPSMAVLSGTIHLWCLVVGDYVMWWCPPKGLAQFSQNVPGIKVDITKNETEPWLSQAFSLTLWPLSSTNSNFLPMTPSLPGRWLVFKKYFWNKY